MCRNEMATADHKFHATLVKKSNAQDESANHCTELIVLSDLIRSSYLQIRAKDPDGSNQPVYTL